MSDHPQTFTVTGSGTHTFVISGMSDHWCSGAGSSWAFDGVDWAAAAAPGPETYAPSDISATAAGAGEVDLAWTAPENTTDLVRYAISRNGTALTTVAPGTTSLTDRTVQPGTAYSYTVTAVHSTGYTSPADGPATATTPSGDPSEDETAPTTPADLTATAASATRINLSWTASSDDVALAGYRIYRNSTLIATTTSTTYSDTPISAGSNNTYAVVAFDGAGNVSDPSGTATATTAAAETSAPSTPTGVSASSTTWSSATVSWTASTDNVGVKSYTISRNGTVIAKVAGSATSFVDATTRPLTAYTYTIIATDAAGNSSTASSGASVTTAAAPAPADTEGPSTPTGLTATAARSRIDLAWTGSTDNRAVAGYRITRDGTLIATTYSTTYSDTGVSPDTAHTYTVTARDGSGNSSSASGSATATAAPALASMAVTYSYDIADRLLAITSASGSSSGFTIDALGRHGSRTVGTGTTQTYSYLGTGDTVVAIAAGSVTTLSAIDALGSRVATSSGGAFGYLLSDLHGNMAAVLGASGTALTDAFRYDAWGSLVGSLTSSLPTPWRFQGRILESAPGTPDLYDFGARSYNPGLGTFTSLDTLRGSAMNPALLNGYLYANGNPATLVDPDGHMAWRDFGRDVDRGPAAGPQDTFAIDTTGCRPNNQEQADRCVRTGSIVQSASEVRAIRAAIDQGATDVPEIVTSAGAIPPPSDDVCRQFEDKLPGCVPPSERDHLKGCESGWIPDEVCRKHQSKTWRTTVTKRELDDLFETLKTGSNINWGLMDDGCYARADVSAMTLLEKGIVPTKVWAFPSQGYLSGPTVDSPDGKHRYKFHVAMAVDVVDDQGQVTTWVIDPSVNNGGPLTKEDWNAALINSAPTPTQTNLGQGPLGVGTGRTPDVDWDVYMASTAAGTCGNATDPYFFAEVERCIASRGVRPF